MIPQLESQFIVAARMARELALKWRRSVRVYNDEAWKRMCLDESRKAFERAHWYIGRERIRRAR